MANKFETESLPRRNISFSIPVEDVMQGKVADAPVKKQKSAPLKTSEAVFVFLMGNAEMKAGWRFAEPSWGVKTDEKVRGIFPDDGHGKGKEEAMSLAKNLAKELGRVVNVIE